MDVFAALAPLIADSEDVIFFAIAVFARISLVAMLAPGFGERFIAVRVRLVVALAMTAIVVPALYDRAIFAPITGPGDLAAIIFTESAAGFVIGFSLRIFVFILQITGAIIAQHLSLSQLFGATVTTEAEAPHAALLAFCGVCLIMISGAHFHLAGAVLSTFDILPFGLAPGFDEVGAWSAERTGKALIFALQLSAPFVIIGFIYSLALAAASRAMPQLSAAFVGSPAIVFAGLALFAVSASIILSLWLTRYHDALGAGLQYVP